MNLGTTTANVCQVLQNGKSGQPGGQEHGFKIRFLVHVSSFPGNHSLSLTRLFLGLEKAIHVKYQTLLSILVILLLSHCPQKIAFLFEVNCLLLS